MLLAVPAGATERLLLGCPRLDVVERDFGFVAACKSHHRGRRTHGRVVEQTLVDVADLLDVERAEG